MPRFVFFLLTLGLLTAAAQTPTTDSSWEIDPDGSTSSPQERPDSGWEIDPNG